MNLLLVEDDKELSKVLNKILTINEYRVTQAYDGVEALDYLARDHYDIIIMDVMMPRLNGIETLKRIRENKNSVPVLMLTAKSMTDDIVVGLDSGADDYLTKPFQMKELLARLRALSKRTQSIASLNIGNIELNPNTYELKAVNSIKLTNKEYKIMELLIHNSNVYLSTDRLLELIWDIDDDIDIGVIWVFISGLRKKLEKIGASYTIKASRGVGYRLEEIR